MSKAAAVPQATLESIRAVVDAIARRCSSPERISSTTGIAPRHVQYAIAAARTLQLLSDGPSGVHLSSTGKALARSPKHSEDERRIWHEAMASSPFLTALAPTLLTRNPPNAEELADRILQTTGLSTATARHRATMILTWRAKAMQQRIRYEDYSGMWRRIEIANFRSIERAVIELPPFAVVVGPNGSGKSNFADALVFARDISFDASAALSSRGGVGGVRRWRPTKPTDVTLDVRASATRKGLEKSYSRHYMRIHSLPAGRWNFTKELIEIVENGEQKAFLRRSGNSVQSFPDRLPVPDATASAMISVRQFKEFSSTSALRNVRRYRLSPESMRQPQLSSENTRLEETGANIAVAIQSIQQRNQLRQIVEPMAKIIPGLQDIYVEQVGRFLALKFKQTQVEGAIADFNATEMSEGSLRALGIVVATHQMVRDELLIIEEPEVSIHPGAAALLFDILKEASHRGSVLVTTHSADLLDAAKDEEILVCRYSGGSTRIGRLDQAQREIVREGLFSIAELMRSEPLRIEDEQPRRRSARR